MGFQKSEQQKTHEFWFKPHMEVVWNAIPTSIFPASILKTSSHTYMGTPTLLPKQPIEVGWVCLDTQIWFDHLLLIVQTVCLERSDLRRNPFCLQSEHNQIEIILTVFQCPSLALSFLFSLTFSFLFHGIKTACIFGMTWDVTALLFWVNFSFQGFWGRCWVCSLVFCLFVSLHAFHLWICKDIMTEGDETKSSSKAFKLKLHFTIYHRNGPKQGFLDARTSVRESLWNWHETNLAVALLLGFFSSSNCPRQTATQRRQTPLTSCE